MTSHQTVTVLDFGGRYSQLIARRVCEYGVYCEVKSHTTPLERLRVMEPIGFIPTGGPNSVYETSALKTDPTIFELGASVPGICHGCQFVARVLGGQATKARGDIAREYDKTKTCYDIAYKLFKGLPERDISQISHGDYVVRMPEGFAFTAHSDVCLNVATTNGKRGLHGMQYHPETSHTKHDMDTIRNFLYKARGTKGDWTMGDYKESFIKAIRGKVGDGKVLLAPPGDVDFSVAVAPLAGAVGSQLTCVLVSHGLMHKNEDDGVEATFSKWDIRFVRVDAEARFLEGPSGVNKPERKHKVIGGEFIRVSEEEVKKISRVDYLVQGTIYPDVIGSGADDIAVTRNYHGVGGLPDYVNSKEVIESLRLLLKDEVWQLGHELSLSEYLVIRQPFPGPDLAIRVIDDLIKEKSDTLRDADAIYREEITTIGEDKSISQYLAVLTNIRSASIMGDDRIYDYALVLRAITTSNFMTTDWVRIPYDALDKTPTRIINEMKGINRIVCDITSKPPITIEWG